MKGSDDGVRWLLDDDAVAARLDEGGFAVESLMGEGEYLQEPLISAVGRRRVKAERQRLEGPGCAERGFRVAAVGEQQWRVDLFNLGGPLGEDLADRHRCLLSLEVRFVGNFPLSPPLIRVLCPRLQYPTRHVMAGGVLMLVPGILDSWKAQPMEQVISQVRHALQNARLDAVENRPVYTPEEAQSSIRRLFREEKDAGAHWPYQLALFSSEHMGASHHRHGNRVCLPASVLRDLTAHGEALPSPLLLEIRSKDTGLRSFIGVLEFSAAEGTVVAPGWVLQNLGLLNGEEGSRVQLRMASLPKCTFLRLQPFARRFLEAAGRDREQVLAAMEWQLPRFAAFSIGDVLKLEHDGVASPVLVLAAEPAAAVTCIAEPYLDIEIDFAAPLDASLGRSADNSVAAAAAAEGGASAAPGGSVLGDAADGVLCGHCQRRVPSQALMMHQVSCVRRMQICPQCNMAVPRESWDSHLQAEHSIVFCVDGCGKEMERRQVPHHQEHECPERKVSCPNGCNYFASARFMLAEHVEACGAKSWKCDLCGCLGRLRDRATHHCGGEGALLRCPLCIDSVVLVDELAWVRHCDSRHAGSNELIQCPLCRAEGAVALGETAPLAAHMELHRYRLRMRSRDGTIAK